ncbi:S8 family serine peptidase [Peribacillus sp. SCS-155]|uniref:S8 family serine peptidase n=1 Tax=Peribacillus sedimenti TaxID=3115297 RepID=UPI0039060ACE
MKKTWVLALLLIVQPSAAFAFTDVKIPPLPPLSSTEKQTAIVTLKAAAEDQITRIKNQYPDIEIRKVYKLALNGLSVTASPEALKKLRADTAVESINQVSEYRAEMGESISFVGTDRIRNIFDGKNQRITGRGIRVGVIDTGLDYTHPDLRKSYAYGRDLVDGDDDPMETKGGKWKSTLHGTHVAGIIAANGKMKGVAPEASIIAYRALGPGGTGTTEQILAAIEAAIKDRVHVINLSLGNNINGPDLPISMALNKAVDRGIVAVASNGNSGPGLWTVGSPGTAEKAISVGASTPPLEVPYFSYGLGSRKRTVRLMPLQGARDWRLSFSEQVVYGGLGKEDDLRDVNGKVVLVKRGKITFDKKVRNAERAGAKAVIIFNNMKGSFVGTLEEQSKIPAVSISRNEGEMLRREAVSRNGLLGDFFYKHEFDLLADFSSRGPVTSTWAIKPDILAPGVNIESTIPSGYMSLQGTSMAAPHVAGACALLLQAHPEWSPQQIKSALMSTAKPLKRSNFEFYRAFEQGAGRLQIEQAIRADTLLSPNTLGFGMFEKKSGIDEHKQHITIENTGSSTKHYSFDMPRKEKGISWDLPSSFSIGPRRKKTVALGLQINPRQLQKGIYDGYLTMREGTARMNIPFLYVKEVPDYPRVMGFDFGVGDKEGLYKYEAYLPGGAEEFGIALYEEESLRFSGFLDWGRHLPSGMVSKEISEEKIPEKGIYKAVVFARTGGKESRINSIIVIN